MIDPLVAALKLVNLSLNFKKISKRKKKIIKYKKYLTVKNRKFIKANDFKKNRREKGDLSFFHKK